jgi:hypothetical protein
LEEIMVEKVEEITNLDIEELTRNEEKPRRKKQIFTKF